MRMESEMKKHLEEKMLPFWTKLIDRENGGFYGFMDSNLQVDQKAYKGCILNSRILWFFSNAAIVLKKPELLPYAEHAYRFMVEHCLDQERGGVYWSVDYQGKPLDTTKHTYNQAFAIYALASYYRASGNQAALQQALTLQKLLEEKCFDECGYKEAQSIDFQPIENDKLSENGVIAERTMNTLLHVMEAYTELFRVSGEEVVREKLHWILDVIAEKIYHPELHRQEVFFDRNMHSLIDLHSYGHDIETAWLVDRCCQVLGEQEYIDKMNPITQDLSEQILKTAYDRHSVKNECDRGKEDETRVWWVQAESVVGFYNAWQKQPEKQQYKDAAEDIWQFIKEKVVDAREGGEWTYWLDKDGNPTGDKPMVNEWKCPYHNGRMCLEIIQRIGA